MNSVNPQSAIGNPQSPLTPSGSALPPAESAKMPPTEAVSPCRPAGAFVSSASVGARVGRAQDDVLRAIRRGFSPVEARLAHALGGHAHGGALSAGGAE
jgi:hypothetical protein